MATSTIEIKDLSVSYERKRVLSNIFLKLNRGTTIGVIGPNGAGKSTLFKAILGLIDIQSGSILIEGKPIAENRKSIAYVPQKDEVDWNFPARVIDIVLMGRYPHKKVFSRMNKQDHIEAEAALKTLNILNLKNRQIGQLSGGQQQRVFIARALCQDPQIFLLDEPFVGVDIPTEHKIVEILQQLADRGKTLLVVHHDLSSVPDYFEEVILLNQRLIAYGNTDSVFTQENIAKTYGGQLSILQKVTHMH